MKKIELVEDGIVICQAENNHVTVRDHGHMIFHGAVTDELKESELLALWENIKNHMKG